MKTILNITVLLLLTGLSSCEKRISLSTAMSVGIRILFVDDEGSNILQKTDPEFKVGDLRLYYYNDQMEYVQRFDSRLDYPYYTGAYDSISVGLQPIFGKNDGTYIEGGRSTSYLDFGNGDIDTIQVAGSIGKSFMIIEDVWYNGKKREICEILPCGFTVVK